MQSEQEARGRLSAPQNQPGLYAGPPLALQRAQKGPELQVRAGQPPVAFGPLARPWSWLVGIRYGTLVRWKMNWLGVARS